MQVRNENTMRAVPFFRKISSFTVTFAANCSPKQMHTVQSERVLWAAAGTSVRIASREGSSSELPQQPPGSWHFVRGQHAQQAPKEERHGAGADPILPPENTLRPEPESPHQQPSLGQKTTLKFRISKSIHSPLRGLIPPSTF